MSIISLKELPPGDVAAATADRIRLFISDSHKRLGQKGADGVHQPYALMSDVLGMAVVSPFVVPPDTAQLNAEAWNSIRMYESNSALPFTLVLNAAAMQNVHLGKEMHIFNHAQGQSLISFINTPKSDGFLLKNGRRISDHEVYIPPGGMASVYHIGNNDVLLVGDLYKGNPIPAFNLNDGTELEMSRIYPGGWNRLTDSGGSATELVVTNSIIDRIDFVCNDDGPQEVDIVAGSGVDVFFEVGKQEKIQLQAGATSLRTLSLVRMNAYTFFASGTALVDI